ncbi:MAG: LysM peptidoglycan-binding domain-containing protein [Fibrobacterales bacterium]
MSTTTTSEQTLRTYTVQAGDSLTLIADRYDGVSREDIYETNKTKIQREIASHLVNFNAYIGQRSAEEINEIAEKNEYLNSIEAMIDQYDREHFNEDTTDNSAMIQLSTLHKNNLQSISLQRTKEPKDYSDLPEAYEIAGTTNSIEMEWIDEAGLLKAIVKKKYVFSNGDIAFRHELALSEGTKPCLVLYSEDLCFLLRDELDNLVWTEIDSIRNGRARYKKFMHSAGTHFIGEFVKQGTAIRDKITKRVIDNLPDQTQESLQNEIAKTSADIIAGGTIYKYTLYEGMVLIIPEVKMINRKIGWDEVKNSGIENSSEPPEPQRILSTTKFDSYVALCARWLTLTGEEFDAVALEATNTLSVERQISQQILNGLQYEDYRGRGLPENINIYFPESDIVSKQPRPFKVNSNTKESSNTSFVSVQVIQNFKYDHRTLTENDVVREEQRVAQRRYIYGWKINAAGEADDLGLFYVDINGNIRDLYCALLPQKNGKDFVPLTPPELTEYGYDFAVRHSEYGWMTYLNKTALAREVDESNKDWVADEKIRQRTSYWPNCLDEHQFIDYSDCDRIAFCYLPLEMINQKIAVYRLNSQEDTLCYNRENVHISINAFKDPNKRKSFVYDSLYFQIDYNTIPQSWLTHIRIDEITELNTPIEIPIHFSEHLGLISRYTSLVNLEILQSSSVLKQQHDHSDSLDLLSTLTEMMSTYSVKNKDFNYKEHPDGCVSDTYPTIKENRPLWRAWSEMAHRIRKTNTPGTLQQKNSLYKHIDTEESFTHITYMKMAADILWSLFNDIKFKKEYEYYYAYLVSPEDSENEMFSTLEISDLSLLESSALFAMTIEETRDLFKFRSTIQLPIQIIGNAMTAFKDGKYNNIADVIYRDEIKNYLLKKRKDFLRLFPFDPDESPKFMEQLGIADNIDYNISAANETIRKKNLNGMLENALWKEKFEDDRPDDLVFSFIKIGGVVASLWGNQQAGPDSIITKVLKNYAQYKVPKLRGISKITINNAVLNIQVAISKLVEDDILKKDTANNGSNTEQKNTTKRQFKRTNKDHTGGGKLKGVPNSAPNNVFKRIKDLDLKAFLNDDSFKFNKYNYFKDSEISKLIKDVNKLDTDHMNINKGNYVREIENKKLGMFGNYLCSTIGTLVATAQLYVIYKEKAVPGKDGEFDLDIWDLLNITQAVGSGALAITGFSGLLRMFEKSNTLATEIIDPKLVHSKVVKKLLSSKFKKMFFGEVTTESIEKLSGSWPRGMKLGTLLGVIGIAMDIKAAMQADKIGDDWEYWLNIGSAIGSGLGMAAWIGSALTAGVSGSAIAGICGILGPIGAVIGIGIMSALIIKEITTSSLEEYMKKTFTLLQDSKLFFEDSSEQVIDYSPFYCARQLVGSNEIKYGSSYMYMFDQLRSRKFKIKSYMNTTSSNTSPPTGSTLKDYTQTSVTDLHRLLKLSTEVVNDEEREVVIDRFRLDYALPNIISNSSITPETLYKMFPVESCNLLLKLQGTNSGEVNSVVLDAYKKCELPPLSSIVPWTNTDSGLYTSSTGPMMPTVHVPIEKKISLMKKNGSKAFSIICKTIKNKMESDLTIEEAKIMGNKKDYSHSPRIQITHENNNSEESNIEETIKVYFLSFCSLGI